MLWLGSSTSFLDLDSWGCPLLLGKVRNLCTEINNTLEPKVLLQLITFYARADRWRQLTTKFCTGVHPTFRFLGFFCCFLPSNKKSRSCRCKTFVVDESKATLPCRVCKVTASLMKGPCILTPLVRSLPKRTPQHFPSNPESCQTTFFFLLGKRKSSCAKEKPSLAAQKKKQ